VDPVVLLDSHVLVWLALDAKRLSRPAAKAIHASRRRLLADISLREVAVLSMKTVVLDGNIHEWLTSAIETFDLEVIAIDPRIAARSTHIAQNFHGDPADQLIAATAIEFDVPLITADAKLRASPALRTIW
jgi:PIN domain nuclease of toxin-antitoxin system